MATKNKKRRRMAIHEKIAQSGDFSILICTYRKFVVPLHSKDTMCDFTQ